MVNKKNNDFSVNASSSLQNQNLNIFDIENNESNSNNHSINLPRRWRYVDKFDCANLKSDLKNEIITSNELLKQDRFEIDLLKVEI